MNVGELDKTEVTVGKKQWSNRQQTIGNQMAEQSRAKKKQNKKKEERMKQQSRTKNYT